MNNFPTQCVWNKLEILKDHLVQLWQNGAFQNLEEHCHQPLKCIAPVSPCASASLCCTPALQCPGPGLGRNSLPVSSLLALPQEMLSSPQTFFKAHWSVWGIVDCRWFPRQKSSAKLYAAIAIVAEIRCLSQDSQMNCFCSFSFLLLGLWNCTWNCKEQTSFIFLSTSHRFSMMDSWAECYLF